MKRAETYLHSFIQIRELNEEDAVALHASLGYIQRCIYIDLLANILTLKNYFMEVVSFFSHFYAIMNMHVLFTYSHLLLQS